MINFVNSFKSLVKLEQIHTDNNVFKLHYKFSVIMLIVFSILLTSKHYFGEAIDCDVQHQKSVIDTYCWIYGTYIIKSTMMDEYLPGLGNYEPQSLRQHHTGDKIIFQHYYQWVFIMFCFQALLFYLPRYIWKCWEGGRMQLLVKDFNEPLVSPNWDSLTKSKFITYLQTETKSHNVYTLRYSLCEVLNFFNVFIQIFMLDWFLKGQFLYYGYEVATYTKINPMDMAFPIITKCLYRYVGASGSYVKLDALCVLPLNVLNEKLFLILWFWLFFLLFLSAFAIVYRVIVLMSPKFRVYLLMAQSRPLSCKAAKEIVNSISFGDFFVLYNVGKNVNPIIFKELVVGLGESMKTKKTYQAFGDETQIVDV